MGTDARLEFFKRRAAEGVDSPRLQIATGRCAGGAVEDVAHGRQRHRGRQERPAAIPGGYGVTHMHGGNLEMGLFGENSEKAPIWES